MASVLQQPVPLENELKSAALGIHFGEAEIVEDPQRLLFPPEHVESDEVTRKLTRNGLLWSAAFHGLVFLAIAVTAGVVSHYDMVPEFDAIRATLSDRDVFDDDVLVPKGAEIILQQTSGPAAKKTVLPISRSPLRVFKSRALSR